MKERAIITPGLIRQVQLMLAGGATGKEVAEITGTSEGTISRIKKAGFDYEQFQKNTEARRKPVPERVKELAEALYQETVKQPEQLALQGGVDYQVKVNEELPGQIGMDLQPEKPEMSDQVKLMRFLAGKFDEVDPSKQLTVIGMKLDKISDYLGQILRVIGPEGGKRG